jgi:hypothetical protein
MPTAPAPRGLAVSGRSATGQPRTFRLEPSSQPAASQNAAYRRLAAVLLGLDVPTLALELRTARRRLAPHGIPRRVGSR